MQVALSTKIDLSLARRLDAYIRATGKTKVAVIDEALKEYLSKEEQPMRILEIILPQFGPVTHLDAAEVIQGDTVVAIVPEPEARTNPGFDEDAFRAAILAEIQSWEDYEPGKYIVQFDPGRDNPAEIET
jgi:hypothetical protein